MSFQPPADMTNGLCYEAPSLGVVRVHVVRDGRAVSSFDCAEPDLGFLAASMLNYAAHLGEQRGERAASRIGEDYKGPVIAKSQVSIVRNHASGEGLVVIRTGQAEIGIRAPNTALTGLGRALLAAGGGGTEG